MDTKGKSDAEFRNDVHEILARHESSLDQVNAALQTVLTELQALRHSRRHALVAMTHPKRPISTTTAGATSSSNTFTARGPLSPSASDDCALTSAAIPEDDDTMLVDDLKSAATAIATTGVASNLSQRKVAARPLVTVQSPPNKETLIAGGPFVLPLAHKHNVKILPADSEHSAIFQCIQGWPEGALRRIILTASGGTMTGVLSAATEKVVELFINKQISYLDNFKVVEATCDAHQQELVFHPSLGEIIHYDQLGVDDDDQVEAPEHRDTG